MYQQAMAQQNHSNPSTPQSQTPTTSLHGGPPTPTPVHHQGGLNQPPTPTSQQAVMFSPHGVPNMPPHSGPANSPYVNVMPVMINQGMHQGGHHQNLSHTSGNHHVIPSSQVPVSLQQVAQQGGMAHYQGPPGRV